jgi:hypothetical protein
MLRVVRVVVARNKFNRFAFTHHKSLEQYPWRNHQTICSRGQQSSDVYTGIECVYTKAITWISREILTASKRNRMYTYCCRQWLSNRERVFFWIWVNFFLKSFRKVSLGWQREHGKAMSWWRTTQEYTTFTGPVGIKRGIAIRTIKSSYTQDSAWLEYSFVILSTREIKQFSVNQKDWRYTVEDFCGSKLRRFTSFKQLMFLRKAQLNSQLCNSKADKCHFWQNRTSECYSWKCCLDNNITATSPAYGVFIDNYNKPGHIIGVVLWFKQIGKRAGCPRK